MFEQARASLSDAISTAMGKYEHIASVAEAVEREIALLATNKDAVATQIDAEVAAVTAMLTSALQDRAGVLHDRLSAIVEDRQSTLTVQLDGLKVGS